MNDSQRSWCLRIITHLFQWKLTVSFRQPVNPEVEDLPGYFDAVRRPMDLETIRASLLDGKYTDLQSFVSDLRLIWENAKTYFGPDTVMTFISDEILQYLDHEFQYANLSAEQIWYSKLTEIQKKIEAHTNKKHPALG
jgi:hypothetical protein